MTISLRNSFSVIALSTALVMGACSPKDKSGSPQISAESAPLGLSAPSDKAFARHFSVPSRKVDDAQASQALAQLGLSESGESDLSWDKRAGKNGNYTFTNLSSTSDDGSVTIAKAELTGVHMDGDVASFDRADFSGLTLLDDDVKINVKTMSVARPTPDTAKAIMKSLEEMSDTDMSVNIDDDDLDFGFGAISLADITVTGDEVTGTVDQMVYGTDEKTELTDFKVSDIDLTILPKNGGEDAIASVLTLKSFSGIGFRTKDITAGLDAGRNIGAGLGGLLNNLNMAQKPYDSFTLEKLAFDNANVNVDIAGFEGKATTKGDVTRIKQVGKPMIFKLKEAPKSREGKQFWDVMTKLDFNEIVLRSSQTSVLDKGADTVRVEDGILEMTDGFKLNYTYGASGIQAMQEVMKTGSSPKAQEKAAMEMLSFNDMKISLEDNSIVERGMKLAGEMRGADPERLKKEMRVAVTMAPLMARNDLEKELASELGTAFMDFIDNGGTLTIELDPAEPIPMSEMMMFDQKADSLKSLGFSARQDN